MKHTPAPWTITELTHTSTGITYSFIESSEGWANSGMAGKRTVAEVGHWKDRPNPEHDACLIAASPIMLKELEHAEQTLRNLGNGDLTGDAQTIALNAAKNIRNTIKKATS